MRIRFYLASLLVLFFTANAEAQDATPVFHKGIALSSWLANAPRQPIFERDFIQIKKAGFDHVRLPVNPEQFGFSLDSAASVDWTPVDNAIALAVKYKLPVILDIHAPGSFTKKLEADPAAVTSFTAMWTALAQRYQHYPAGVLAFELLNEPQYYNAESDYNALMRKLVAAIRQVDTKHLIIVGAPHGSSIKSLPFMQPIDDAHIAYAFHFYEPYMVTHQGVHRGFEGKMLKSFRGVPYPVSLVTRDAAFYAPEAPNPAQAQSELAAYVQEGWSAQHVAERIRIAHDWAEQHHVQLLCGEFGVLRNHIDPESRYRWINDVRTALESNGIGWQLWDYADLDGITTPVGPTRTDPVDGSVRLINAQTGSRAFDPLALKALGLK